MYEGQYDKALQIYLKLSKEAAQVFTLIEKYDLFSSVQVCDLVWFAFCLIVVCFLSFINH